MAPGNDPAQNIEDLRERYDHLKTQKITAEANLKTSTDNLDRLKRQARESYGTDDLEELRRILQKMKDDNDRKCADYQRDLDKIERQLEEVERQHDEAACKELQS
jgi:hypothetical protein